MKPARKPGPARPPQLGPHEAARRCPGWSRRRSPGRHGVGSGGVAEAQQAAGQLVALDPEGAAPLGRGSGLGGGARPSPDRGGVPVQPGAAKPAGQVQHQRRVVPGAGGSALNRAGAVGSSRRSASLAPAAACPAASSRMAWRAAGPPGALRRSRPAGRSAPTGPSGVSTRPHWRMKASSAAGRSMPAQPALPRRRSAAAVPPRHRRSAEAGAAGARGTDPATRHRSSGSAAMASSAAGSATAACGQSGLAAMNGRDLGRPRGARRQQAVVQHQLARHRVGRGRRQRVRLGPAVRAHGGQHVRPARSVGRAAAADGSRAGSGGRKRMAQQWYRPAHPHPIPACGASAMCLACGPARLAPATP